MTLEAQDFRQLSSLAFSAALDPGKWDLFLDALSQLSGGVFTQIIGADKLGGAAGLDCAPAYDPEWLAKYNEYYSNKNLWADGFLNGEVGVPMSAEQMCPREKMENSEFYQDWVLPNEDIIGGGGTVLFRDDKRLFLLGGNIRRKDVDKLEARWLRNVAAVTPMAQYALEINRTLTSLSFERWAYCRQPFAGQSAIIVINTERQIIYSNSAADAMLSAGTQIKFDHKNKLYFLDTLAQKIILEVAQNLRTNHVGTMAAAQLSDTEVAGGYTCRIMGFHPADLDFSPFGYVLSDASQLALVTISKNSKMTNLSQDLGSMFGLTPAENEIARHCVNGLSVKEMSMKREVSQHTIRNQLKSVFLKTDTTRQSELVSLFLKVGR